MNHYRVLMWCGRMIHCCGIKLVVRMWRGCSRRWWTRIYFTVWSACNVYTLKCSTYMDVDNLKFKQLYCDWICENRPLLRISVPFCSAVLALYCSELSFSKTHSIAKSCKSEHEHMEGCNLRKHAFNRFAWRSLIYRICNAITTWRSFRCKPNLRESWTIYRTV